MSKDLIWTAKPIYHSGPETVIQSRNAIHNCDNKHSEHKFFLHLKIVKR